MIFSERRRLPTRMLCYGASGNGVHWALDARHQAAGAVAFAGYVDDLQDPRRVGESGQPVLGFDELLALDDVGVLVPVLDPTARRALHARLDEHEVPILGMRGAAHLAHPDAVMGLGTLVTCTTRVGHSAVLGRGVVAAGTVIGHDVVIGDFTSLAVGSVVLGHVTIGSGAFVGAGAVIHNGTIERPITIGDGAVLGAGAVVMRDVPAGAVVVSPRAMTLPPRDSHDA